MTNQNSSRRSFLLKSTLATTGLALLTSSQVVANLTTNQSPYLGYNPYSEASVDLRKGVLPMGGVKIQGQLFEKDGKTVIPNAKIEVWHLSPNSKKYRHNGHFFTDEEGNYSFLSDFPMKDSGSPKIFFKATKDGVETFTQLVFLSNGANIMSDHWELNQQLGEKVLPKKIDNSFFKQFEFNFTLS